MSGLLKEAYVRVLMSESFRLVISIRTSSPARMGQRTRHGFGPFLISQTLGITNLGRWRHPTITVTYISRLSVTTHPSSYPICPRWREYSTTRMSLRTQHGQRCQSFPSRPRHLTRSHENESMMGQTSASSSAQLALLVSSTSSNS